MIVLDASVLIALLDRDDGHHDRAVALLAREVDEELAVNPLTLAEVYVAPAQQGRLDDVRTAMSDLGVQELPFPGNAAVVLAGLRVSTHLRMPDCCVLLAAEQSRARVASFDERLADVAAARGLTVLRR